MILLGLALFACGEPPAAPRAEVVTESPDAVRVEVAAMRPSTARLELVLPGDVRGSRDATLAASLGGYVEAVRAQEGNAVHKGQALLSVDASLHNVTLAQATAQDEQATSNLERVRALGERASKAELQASETAAKVAKSAREAAQIRAGRAVITAPFDGVVAQLDAEVGEVLSPGAPAVRLVKLDPVEIELAVSDRDVVALQEGNPVEVRLNARSERFTGTVKRVAPAADSRSRAFPVTIEVANPDSRLLPGMIAQVRISQVLREDALVLPQGWLVTNLDSRGVFVEENGVARWHPLELGPVVRDEVIVESGLAIGDKVVFTGHRELIDGDALLVTRSAACCEAGRVVEVTP